MSTKRFLKFDYYKFMPKWTTANAPLGGSYNYAYYFIHPWRLIEDWYYQIKWFLQRGWRGYGENDVWSLDWYLTSWLPSAMGRLNKHGHPAGMTDKGWETRLKCMIAGFKAAREIQDMKHKYKSREQKAAWKRFHTGMKLFHECFFDLWD
jgi:hypothetical protein